MAKAVITTKGITSSRPHFGGIILTLRIEGTISDIPDEQQQIDETFKFSSFLSAISVDLFPNENYPNIQESQSHIIEWRDDGPNANKPPASVSFDGLISRGTVFSISRQKLLC